MKIIKNVKKMLQQKDINKKRNRNLFVDIPNKIDYAIFECFLCKFDSTLFHGLLGGPRNKRSIKIRLLLWVQGESWITAICFHEQQQQQQILRMVQLFCLFLKMKTFCTLEITFRLRKVWEIATILKIEKISQAILKGFLTMP